MISITFDTFKYVERLERAGISREQASVLVEAQRDALSQTVDSTVATKTDLIRLESRMDTMEARLSAKFDKVIWMLGALVAGVLAFGVRHLA